MRRRNYFTLALGLLCTASTIICACDDSDTTTSSDAGAGDAGGTDSGPAVKTDGGTTQVDATTGTDSSAPGDAASDAPPPDAQVDAGPTVTSTLGSTGYIRIYENTIQATFFEDDLVLRASDAPNCVARVRSLTKPRSGAGVLTVGGPIIGSDGGAPDAITIFGDDTNRYSYDGPIFGENPPSLIVGMDATETFPTLSNQTLRPPPVGVVTITKPARPDAGDLIVVPTVDLEIAWTPPADTANLQLSVDYVAIEGLTRRANVYCSFPLASGTGRMPASLLTAVRAQLGGTASGLLSATVGGAIEVAPSGASYILRTLRFDGTTNIPEGDPISASLP